jgi:branched-chain amino acid transport system substrate-binding protein
MSDEIKVGILVTLFGPFEAMGNDGLAGVNLALAEFGGTIGSKRIKLYVEGTNAIPDSAVFSAQELLDKQQVDFIIGPLSGNEGLAMRDFAKTRPDKTFLNGSSGTQDMTLRNPAPNFYNFATNGVQWMAGLGSYVYDVQGYRRVATLGEDYSFPYGQVGSFTVEFCRAGGHVARNFWVPLGKSQYEAVIDALPDDIDALFLALGGADAINFLEQYLAADRAKPLIAGSIAIDQNILNATGPLADHLIGTASASVIADDNPDPAWQAFIKAYCNSNARGFNSPSLSAYCYYVNTKAALLALQEIGGEFSKNQENFKQVLKDLEFETPTGPVKLDHNRQAIANTFIRVVDSQHDGTLYNRLVKTMTNVNQTLGIAEAEFLALGEFTHDNPLCP